MARIKTAIAKENLNPYLICQPLGYFCPDVENSINGYLSLPEAPMCMGVFIYYNGYNIKFSIRLLGLDPRQMTRIDAHKFAREAWELGIRYIGGCCGMESHHIRAIAQEVYERN